MRVLSVLLVAVFVCIGPCSCDSARSSRDPTGPDAPQAQHAAASAASSESVSTGAAQPSALERTALTVGHPKDVEVTGPGSEMLVVHVQVIQEDKWAPFSVRVQDFQGTTLGAFVVPYSQQAATFSLRLTDPKLVGLRAGERVTLRVVPQVVRSGEAFPHSVELSMGFRAEP